MHAGTAPRGEGLRLLGAVSAPVHLSTGGRDYERRLGGNKPGVPGPGELPAGGEEPEDRGAPSRGLRGGAVSGAFLSDPAPLYALPSSLRM